jgi:hypothetical protein
MRYSIFAEFVKRAPLRVRAHRCDTSQGLQAAILNASTRKTTGVFLLMGVG